MEQDQIQIFLTFIKNEIEIIKKCNTSAGFIERISRRLLPKLRNHKVSSEVIKKWDAVITREENELDTLARRGCKELTLAFKELWCELVSKPKDSLTKKIPRSLSGCTINGVAAARFH